MVSDCSSQLVCGTIEDNKPNSVSKVDLPFWAGKTEIKNYLEKVNENGKVTTILYCF